MANTNADLQARAFLRALRPGMEQDIAGHCQTGVENTDSLGRLFLRSYLERNPLSWPHTGQLRNLRHPPLPYLCAHRSPIVAVPPSPPADPTRILLASNLEVNYWCQTLNCTETRLRNAVLAVGPLSADVRLYLAR